MQVVYCSSLVDCLTNSKLVASSQIFSALAITLSVVKLLSLLGYLEILYVNLLVFHRDPWRAYLFFLLCCFKDICVLVSISKSWLPMSGRPHLGRWMTFSVSVSSSPVCCNPAKCCNSLKKSKSQEKHFVSWVTHVTDWLRKLIISKQIKYLTLTPFIRPIKFRKRRRKNFWN